MASTAQEGFTEEEFLALLNQYKVIRSKDWRGWGPTYEAVTPTATTTNFSPFNFSSLSPSSSTSTSTSPFSSIFSALSTPTPTQSETKTNDANTSETISSFKFDPSLDFWGNLRNLIRTLFPPNSETQVERVFQRFRSLHSEWVANLNIEDVDEIAQAFPATLE